MKIIFFGTGEFALPALKSLSREIVLVVTQPDRPSGRGLALKPSPIKLLAQQLGLIVESPERSRDPNFVQRVSGLNADALVVASYGQILSQELLSAAKFGGINLHGSILPAYRGAAPIQRAILNGEEETGVTLMQMDRGMDTGDIIAIERTPIGDDETYSELQERLAEIAANMASEWLTRIVKGDYPKTPQDHARASLAPKFSRDEREISFERPADEEFNRFRALTEKPGALLSTTFGRIKVRRARMSDLDGTPGEVLTLNSGITLGFRTGSIEVLEAQPEGKKGMSGRDLANGWRLKPGANIKP
jgi:methionyl-tRNA formyltransferase